MSDHPWNPGTRLYAATTATQVIVITPPAQPEGSLHCAGAPMTLTAPAAVDADLPSSIALGKRYADETSGMVVLCSNPGAGPLSYAGRDLVAQGARALPASD